MEFCQDKKGITFIEILVVLSVILILLSFFLFIWNESSFAQKARDAKRINDLHLVDLTLKTILQTNEDVYLGDENVIYVSLPDSSLTCSNYNLIPVFSPFSYRCKKISSYLNLNGSGWIPVDFTLSQTITFKSLPTDPLNNSDYFYAYQVKNGKYKLTARFEDPGNYSKLAFDGGFEPTLYEVGSSLDFPSPQSGLVLYFPFEEGTGTTTKDLSGYGNNGVLLDASTTNSDGNTPPLWVEGKIAKALNFDGTDDYISVTHSPSLPVSTFTIISWLKLSSISRDQKILSKCRQGWSTNGYKTGIYSDNRIETEIGVSPSSWVVNRGYGMVVFSTGTWYHTVSFAGGGKLGNYVNSNLDSFLYTNSIASSGIAPLYVGRECYDASSWYIFSGIIDELRVYNRVLSDLEIKSLYQLTK